MLALPLPARCPTDAPGEQPTSDEEVGIKPVSSSQISSKAPALKLRQFLRDESKRASLPPAGGRLHLGCDSASGLSPQGQIHRISGIVPISHCRDFSCRELCSCPVASAARNSTAELVQGAWAASACSPCASSRLSPQTPDTGWEERSPEAASRYEALRGQNKPPACPPTIT